MEAVRQTAVGLARNNELSSTAVGLARNNELSSKAQLVSRRKEQAASGARPVMVSEVVRQVVLL